MNSVSDNHKKIHVAIFASGNGSNAENLMRYFQDHERIMISLVVTSNEDAGVVKKAEVYAVPVYIITPKDWQNHDFINEVLHTFSTDYIVLAGFLKLMPAATIAAFSGRIINIHPALLPKFGGRGMYGKAVHKQVKLAAEKESGITIHEVNEEYDKGRIIFQKSIALSSDDTAESIEQKVRSLELTYFPQVVENYILSTTYPTDQEQIF